jgi:hypothetical protein
MKTNLQILQDRIVKLVNDYIVNNGDLEALPKLLSGMAIVYEGSLKMVKSIHYLHSPKKDE